MQEKEITIVDLIRLVFEQKLTFILTLILCSTLSIFKLLEYSDLNSQKGYSYKTFFSIGITGKNPDGIIQYIETPDTSIEKIKKIYLPQLNKNILDISIRNPSNTNLIELLSFSQEPNDLQIIEIHRFLLIQLEKSHKEKVEFINQQEQRLGGLNILNSKIESDTLVSKVKEPIYPKKNLFYSSILFITGSLIAAIFSSLLVVFILNVKREL